MVILFNKWKLLSQIFGTRRKTLEDLFVYDILHQVALAVQVQVQAPVFQAPHLYTQHLDMFPPVMYLTSLQVQVHGVQVHLIIQSISAFHLLIAHQLPLHRVDVPCLNGHPQQLQTHGPASATVAPFLRDLC